MSDLAENQPSEDIHKTLTILGDDLASWLSTVDDPEIEKLTGEVFAAIAYENKQEDPDIDFVKQKLQELKKALDEKQLGSSSSVPTLNP